MRRNAPSLSCVVSVLATLACAAPGPETRTPAASDEGVAGEARTVVLRFDWPEGFQAEVETKRTRTRTGEDGSSRSATSRYTMRAWQDGSDLRVGFSDFALEAHDLGALAPAAQAQLLAQLGDLVPDFVVTRTGEFAGIADFEVFRGRLDLVLHQALPKGVDPSALPAVTEIRRLLTSQEFLESRAAGQWNALVGTWLEGELELRAVYSYEERSPVPVFPDEEILTSYEFSAERLLPCPRSGEERECVELELRSITDPADAKRMIESLLRRLTPAELRAAALFTDFELENVIRLVTEPRGLIPHRHEETKSLRGTVSVGGQTQRVEQIDVTESSYGYP